MSSEGLAGEQREEGPADEDEMGMKVAERKKAEKDMLDQLRDKVASLERRGGIS